LLGAHVFCLSQDLLIHFLVFDGGVAGDLANFSCRRRGLAVSTEVPVLWLLVEARIGVGIMWCWERVAELLGGLLRCGLFVVAHCGFVDIILLD